MKENMEARQTMYCSLCGKRDDTVGMETYYFCTDCSKKPWPRERLYCAKCGKTFEHRYIKSSRNGQPMFVYRRVGSFFCAECGKQQPKYNCTEEDMAALITPERAKTDMVQKAYNRYKSAKQHVIVVYECACETPKKVNHHYDYERPYEVVKLCNSCHRKEHARLDKLRKTKAEKMCQHVEALA
jgi:hypothetical protein